MAFFRENRRDHSLPLPAVNRTWLENKGAGRGKVEKYNKAAGKGDKNGGKINTPAATRITHRFKRLTSIGRENSTDDTINTQHAALGHITTIQKVFMGRKK